MKNLKYILFVLLSVSLTSVSCEHDKAPPTDIILTEGLNHSPQAPNADKELTITFKAPISSELYGYTGDVYVHIGIITEGVWQFVPAAWNENIPKCKMTSTDDENTWYIKLSPTIRQFFNSGNTPIEKIGIVIRSADGSKKGIQEDSFVDITDNKQEVFQPAEVKFAPLPNNVKEGINIINNSTITFVLYDKDKNGVRFDYAHIIGDFNDWTLSNDEKSQMLRDENAGCWWITISCLDAAKEYAFQYYVGKKDKFPIRLTDAYSTKILDPYNDSYIPTNIYPKNKKYPNGAIGFVSVVQIEKIPYNWEITDFIIQNPENIVIYEMLLRDFTTTKDLKGASEKLDYLEKLGITAVELMPIQEFDGNNSWGYNPNHFFATDKAYGTDNSYKKFIDECHKRGIAVILDMVFNHATGMHPFAKMYWDTTNNKTAANNPWFNVNAPHMYSVFHDFNHEFQGTREYFKRVLAHWLTEYKVDGFRMDLTKGFTQKSGTEQRYDQSRIDILTDYHKTVKQVNPNAMFILEHLVGGNEENALAEKGMYLWRNINNSYSQSAMGYQANADFKGMFSSVSKFVGYAESHDEERNFYKAKTWGAGAICTDSVVRLKRIPLNIAFTVLTPGPKMIWQFGELGFDYSINDFGGRTNEKPPIWGWLNSPWRKNAYDMASKIIQLKKDYPNAFSNGNFSYNVSVSDWSAGKRIGVTHPELNMVMVGNFLPSDNIVSKPNFPNTGTWYELLTGEEINVTDPYMTLPIQAGNVKIFTNKRVAN